MIRYTCSTRKKLPRIYWRHLLVDSDLLHLNIILYPVAPDKSAKMVFTSFARGRSHHKEVPRGD